MFAVWIGVGLCALSLMVPLVAATSIASERERGTLSLMTASALTPMQIVAGKLLAVLATIAPFFLPALVLLPLANVYGDVPISWVAAGLLLAAWHAVALASVGVFVSAASERLRTAAPQAMLLGVGLSVVGALPFVVLASASAAGEPTGEVLPFVLFGVLVESAVAWLALVNARSALSPASVSRWRQRRLPLLLLVVGAPLAAAALSYIVPSGHSMEELLALLHTEAALVVFVAVLLEVAVADQARVDARSPAHAALVLTLCAGAATVGARLLPAPSGLEETDDALFTLKWAAVVVVVGYLAFSAMLMALFARALARPAARVAATALVLVGMFIAPLMLHELRHAVDLGVLTFTWTQPIAVIEAVQNGRSIASPVLGLSFFVLAPALLFFAASSRRSRRA
jgi:ABC-type transport system involved in multi-copper enzyme maturation permease subunit